MLIALAAVSTSAEAADRAFTARFSTNDTGQITGIANSLMTCNTGATGGCAASVRQAAAGTAGNSALDNNAYTMGYIDVDGDATTFDSSSATLALPAGSTILFAGLYWGGDYSAGTNGVVARTTAARNTVKFKAPGATAYTSLTASQLDDSTLNVGRYQGFVDVTSRVAAAGNGTYTVADVQAGTGQDRYAGWSLIIAYRNAAEPARNLTIFDGLKTITTTAGPTDIPVSGFLTPPAGTVKTDVGFVTYEGDDGIVGDSAALNGTVLSNAQHPATNFFDSHISFDDANFTAKNPNDANQQGFDMAFTSADGILANSATSATIRVTTSGDQYLPGVITFATEIYAPKIEQSKSVVDDNGGLLEEGDTLSYTITGTNNGQDGTAGFILRDPIPANVDYVPGSLKVNPTGTSPTTAVTDASDTDLGEYVASSNQVQARLGTGASGTAGGNVRPGASYSMTFKVKVHGPATYPVPDGTTIDNTATATYATQTTGTALTTGSSASTTVKAPDLALTKTRTSGTPTAGANTTYTLSVKNVGSARTQGAVTVTDPVPSGTTLVSATGQGWTCTGTTTISCTRSDSLASAGAYPDITVVVKLDNGFSGTLSNTGTVSGGGDGNLSNNTSQDTTPSTMVSDLALTKTASRSTMNIGDSVTFTLTATNNGPSTATSVAISDPLPGGLTYVSSNPGCVIDPPSGVITCTAGTLAPGASATFAIVATAKTGAGATTQTNTATVGGAQTDNNTLNNTASAAVAVSGADLVVTKTSTTAEPIRTGDTVTYTVAVRNNGGSTATGVVLTDVLPSSLKNVTTSNPSACTVGSDVTCNVGTLTSGTTFSVTITGKANAPSGTLTNRASALGNEPDPNLQNNSAQVDKQSAPTADLSAAKSVSSASAGTGDTVTYTLTTTNKGPDAAANATATDVLPSGLTFVSASSGCTYTSANRTITCALGTLASGASATNTITTTVASSAAAGTLSNTVKVKSDTFDNDPSNDQAQAATMIRKAADLSLTKTTPATSATTGDTLTWSLKATNAGPDDAAGVVLTDVLPTGVAYASSSSDCAYDAPSRTVTCTVGTIASGASATRTITVTVTTDAGSSIVNTASAQSATPDPTAANNSGSATTPVVKKADVQITKTATDGPLAGNDALTYTLVAKNKGPDTATSVAVTDVLPAGVTFVMAQDCTYATATRTVTCSGFDLAPEADKTFTIITKVVPDAPATITNTARVAATQTDPDTTNNASTVSTTTTRKADVVLSKTAPAGPLGTGDALRYTLTATNNGPDTASGVAITDTLPTGVSFSSAASGCTYDGATKTVSCAVGTLAPGATKSYTIDTTVLTTSPSSITNTATVSATTTDPTPGNNSGSATTSTVKRADLAITKTAPAGPLGTGDTLTYSLAVKDNGPDDAANVVVSDVLPTGVTYASASSGCTYASASRTVTCSIASLASGATVTRTISTTINGTDNGTIANTATVTSDTQDPTPGNNTSSASTGSARRADLRIAKTGPAGPKLAGDTAAYDLTVTNGGPDAAQNVSITDVLPSGLTFVSASTGCTYTAATRTVTCAAASLSSGASITRTITTTVDADAPATITNTASVSAATTDPDGTNNTSSAQTTTAKRADVALTKSATAGPLSTGDTITYTLTAKDNGPDTARGVTITDVVPDGLGSVTPGSGCTYDAATRTVTCTVGDLAPGASATRTFTAKVLTTAAATVTNTAKADATTPDPTPGNNTDSASTTIAKRADVSVVKSAPAGPVGTGDALPFTLKVANDGPDTAVNVVVTDVLPSGVDYDDAPGCTYTAPSRTVTCTIASLAGGATATRTIATKVNASAGGTIANTAKVTADTPDPDPTDNDSTTSTDVAKRADLKVTKTAPAGPKGAGDTIGYDVTVRNDGPDAAANVVLTDVLPAGLVFDDAPGCSYDAASRTVTCTVASLDSGASVTRTITAKVAPDAPASIANTAKATSDTKDPDPANNQDTATTSTAKRADLSIVKSAPAGPVGAGASLAYTLEVRNAGPDTAASVVVTDQLPDGIAFDGAPGCDYDTATRTVTCAVASLAPGASRTFTVNTKVGTSAAGLVTNTATVASATPDPDPSNDSDDATTAVAADADIAITKTADDTTPAPGQVVTYTLKVTNGGPATATNVKATDTLPAGLTFVSADPACSIGGTTVVCDAGDVPNGGSRSFDIKVKADPLDGTFDPNATHLLTTTKVEQQIDLLPGETKTATVSCGSGVATDGSFRIDAVDQGTGTAADVHATANRQDGDNGWTTSLRNDATGRAQTKVFAVCVSSDTHPLVLSAPVTVTQVLTAGQSTIDLPCGANQLAIAPGFELVGGDARVRRSEDRGTGWSFTVDVPTSTTATFSIRCLSTQLGVVGGHTHDLAFTHPKVTATIGAGQTAEVDVTCPDDGKGIVATYDLPAGVIALGNDPRPKTRAFRLLNTTGSDQQVTVDLLCLRERTGGEVGTSKRIDNTATVSATSPDGNTADNTSTASVDVEGTPVSSPSPAPVAASSPAPAAGPDPVGASPAPSGGSAPSILKKAPLTLTSSLGTLSASGLTLPVSCATGATCRGTATVVAAKRLRVAGKLVPAGAILARTSFTVRAGTRGKVRVTLSRSKVRALRATGQRKVVVRLTTRGRTLVKTVSLT